MRPVGVPDIPRLHDKLALISCGLLACGFLVSLALAPWWTIALTLGLVLLLPFLYRLFVHVMFRRRMKSKGRFIAWTDLEPRLRSGEGLLIIEDRPPGQRVWWVPELPPGTEREIAPGFSQLHAKAVSPALLTLIHPDLGEALFTDPPGYLHTPEDLPTHCESLRILEVSGTPSALKALET